jgi:Tol biopolymer transport system component
LRRRARLPVAVALALAVAAGCVGSTVPQLPVSIATAISEGHMQRLESDDLILYYPGARRDEAVRFLAHVGACVSSLRARALGRSSMSRHKAVLILPELQYNNAFVAPRRAGYEELAVVPTLFTTDEFSLENGLPPDPATIACHEVTHFVQLQQIEGFAFGWNVFFGQAYTPQLGFDAWFEEGLAVYYETRLQPGTGRLASPFWQGVFAAGVAGRRLGGGDLSAFNRDFYAGNHYLVGSRFVRFLAERYGEDKLWRLIDKQARSLLYPFAVNLRFKQAFGKTLSTLIDEFADDVRARTPVVARPRDQRVQHDGGWSARYARAPDGTEALVTADRDQPTRLRVFAPDGRTLVDDELTDVVPPRRLLTSGPTISGGLGFSRDGRYIYFVAVDQDEVTLASRLVRYDLVAHELEVVVDDLQGTGGSVSGDGRHYLFARADGDHHDLAEVDLETHEVRVLAPQPPGTYVAQPRVSPDGKRIVVTTFDGRGFGLALLDATGRRLRALPTGRLLVDDPSWVDDERLVFLGSPSADAGFQVHLLDLRDGSTTQLSRAPYLAFAPRAAAGTVRFLNREGWSWTVDEVALPARAAAPAVAPLEAAPAAPFSPALDVADATRATLAPFPQAPEPLAPRPAAPPPAAALAAPPPEVAANMALTPPALLSDEPAWDYEGLFVPTLRSPLLGVTSAADAVIGASLTGADRLERHRWTLTGLYETSIHKPSFELAYTNREAAPVTLTLALSQVTERYDLGQLAFSIQDLIATERTRRAVFQASRAFYGNPVSAGFSFDDFLYTTDVFFPSPMGLPAPAQPASSHIRLAGGFMSATFAGVERTAYTGTRREFFAQARLAEYPEPWGTLGHGLLDTRGELALTTPLPWDWIDTLTLVLVGRALDLGDPIESQPFLRIGGLPASLLWRHPGPQPTLPNAELPDTIGFREPLRGFEDLTLFSNRVAIAEGFYNYPFIIDHGWASTFGILPSFFVREVDVTLFGAAAVTQERWTFISSPDSYHEAEGAAFTLSTIFGSLPLTLTYQISHRRTDDRGVTQLLTLTD